MLPLRTSREASALPGPRSRDAGSNRSWAFSQGRLLEPSRLSWDAAAVRGCREGWLLEPDVFALGRLCGGR